jgi:hypothetical protein
MILYHGTTRKRAENIFKDGCIKCNVERHYTKEKSGDGYTEQGYIYLALEPTYSLYFANCCNLEDKSSGLVLFKIELDEADIEPDYDEIRYQPQHDFIRKQYSDDLDYSMNEYKSCRYGKDIPLTGKVSYISIDKDENTMKLIGWAGGNLKDTIDKYTDEQKEFIENIKWIPCEISG